MSRNRFDEILKTLHVKDNSKLLQGNNDVFFKPRPIIDDLYQDFYKETR